MGFIDGAQDMNMSSRIHRVSAALMGLCLLAYHGQTSATTPKTEQLIVFVQPDASDLAREFQSRHLPEIKQMAEQMNIRVLVVDAGGGVPEEVGITPLLVFQNHLGRSIYQGRYTTLERIGNFIQTARFMPSTGKLLQRTDTPVWQVNGVGGTKVAAPLKITELTGTRPGDFSAEQFVTEMSNELIRGFSSLQMVDQVSLGKSDRMFYMDFYPHRSADDRFYLGVALFSQFHCHEPIYIRTDEPFSGSWNKRRRVMQEVAAVLEKQMKDFIAGSKIGDGFDVIPTDVSIRSWDELGLALPSVPEQGGATAIDVSSLTLPQSWSVDLQARQQRLPVQFAFASPLESYSGSARRLDGTLTLGEGRSLSQATGIFRVPIESLTMGEPALDKHMRTNLLKMAAFPQAEFRLDQIAADVPDLNFGQIVPARLIGQFTMKGIPTELTVPASLEVYIGPDGQPRMSISGAWSLRLKERYDIEGPDGPAPASDTLNFLCHIILKAAGDSAAP